MNYFKDDKPNGSNRFVLKFGWQTVYGTPTLDQRHRAYRLKVTNLVKSGTSSKIYVHSNLICVNNKLKDACWEFSSTAA